MGGIEPKDVGSVLKHGALKNRREADKDIGGKIDSNHHTAHQPGAIIVAVDDLRISGFIEVGEVKSVNGAAGENSSRVYSDGIRLTVGVVLAGSFC